jgi:ADP-ribosyl-[dinitrogen reductase] hydrolase
MTPPSSTAIIGCLLGTAIGDALGLPYEGLSPQRQRRLFPHPDRHQLVFGKGMVSDDTEHTCMIGSPI